MRAALALRGSSCVNSIHSINDDINGDINDNIGDKIY